MLFQFTALLRGEVAALKGEVGALRDQLHEIAAWLGIEPVDAGLGVATLSGVLAFLF